MVSLPSRLTNDNGQRTSSHPRGRIGTPDIALGHFQIVGVDGAGAFDFFGRNFANDPAGNAHDDRARGDAPAFRDDGAGGDQAFFTDFAARQEPGADADQRIAADALAVHHG